MTHDDAFLQAIIEAPDDDVPRLIYADWLEEHGQTQRAEVIRVQVERAQLPPDDLRHAALQRRDFELRELNEKRWRAELPILRGIIWQRFWRGFVSGADVQGWKFFRRHADALFAATPIQFLRLHGFAAAQCRELAKSSYLGRLRGLDLNLSRPGDDGVCALAGCAALANLRSLELNGPPNRVLQDSPTFAVHRYGSLCLGCIPAPPRLGATGRAEQQAE